ncbi:acyltransferase family protein [Paenibacillus sp. LMG 31461]|uniref:Acyltransferase family protein n=1 Tax=Paenibacillus plantarum TaxID=2654975 RepID=A0ABX1X9R8_9BACL|nr:acyltransferase family protein [Paenibacillus plantarum]NOU65185.1 acyltransferase family protein [Paenibacillus plantarum]
MRRYYPGITIFKLVGCLLVLFAHLVINRYMVSLPNHQLRFISLPLGVIVTCFYVVAGFLAYKGWTNASDSHHYIKRYVNRILMMYVPFCLLFMFEFIAPELFRGGFSFANLGLQAKILTAAVILNGPSVQLWFIPPLIFSLCVCYWLVEKRGVRFALLAGMIGFLMSLLISGSLRSLMVDHLESYLSGGSILVYIKLFVYRYLGLGFTFVLIGVLLARYEEEFNRAKVWPILGAALVVSALEFVYLWRYIEWNMEYKITLSIIPNTILVFYGILRVKSQIIQKYHSFINLFSIVTFCGHILFMRLNLLLLNWEITELSNLQNIVYVASTGIECILVSIVLYKWKSIFSSMTFNRFKRMSRSTER